MPGSPRMCCAMQARLVLAMMCLEELGMAGNARTCASQR